MRRTRVSLALVLLGSLALAGCAAGITSNPDIPQESPLEFEELIQMSWDDMTQADRDKLAMLTGEMSRAEYDSIYHPEIQHLFGFDSGKWERVDIPGAVCGNGSQYRIFINRSTDTEYRNNLLVYFEPGGACWDYASCSGQTGVRGAANPDGIPENYMSFIDMINPFKSGGSPMALISPIIWKNNITGDHTEVARWNKVFVPYCTGDVHAGNSVAVYEDPTGQNEPLTFHHVGATNVEKVVKYLKTEFDMPSELMAAGCSAGGAGALSNYHFLRKGLNPGQSYLLNDSGPVFPAPDADHYQYALQQHIVNVWNLEHIAAGLESDGVASNLTADFGSISAALADHYPQDKLGITLFKRDGTYSAYSYASWHHLDENDPVEREVMLDMWREDVGNMTAQYDSKTNLSYYIPYQRNIMNSHCTTIIDWTGTEMEDSGIEVGDFIDDLIDGGDVTSMEERDNPSDEDVNSFLHWLVNLFL